MKGGISVEPGTAEAEAIKDLTLKFDELAQGKDFGVLMPAFLNFAAGIVFNLVSNMEREGAPIPDVLEMQAVFNGLYLSLRASPEPFPEIAEVIKAKQAHDDAEAKNNIH